MAPIDSGLKSVSMKLCCHDNIPSFRNCVDQLIDSTGINSSFFFDYTSNRPSLDRCRCALNLIRDINDNNSIQGLLNFCSNTDLELECIKFCYHTTSSASTVESCRRLPCNGTVDMIDICIVKGKDKEGQGVTIYGVSCDTLSRHGQGVCESLQGTVYTKLHYTYTCILESQPSFKLTEASIGVFGSLLVIIVLLSSVLLCFYRKHVKR